VGPREHKKKEGREDAFARGNYLTVWKTQADDTWKAVFDIGSAL